MLVVSQDKKPLTPLDVEALCKYCRLEVHPMMMRAEDESEYSPEESMSTDTVLAVICRATFSILWRRVRDEKCESEGKWDLMKSVYPFGR